MYIVEYRLKKPKDFLDQWEKSREHFPKGCHLIQAITTKDGQMCFAVFDVPTHKLLHEFHKKHLDQFCDWKILEIDEYHIEGDRLRKAQ